MNEQDIINEIQWDEDYSVGDEEIDKEHKEFFDIVKQAKLITEITSEETKKETLQEILSQLHQYVNLHFDKELDYMKKINYPDIQEHKEQHKTIQDKINYISFNLRSASLQQAEEQLYYFVKKIFVKHIVEEDIKISEYVHKKF